MRIVSEQKKPVKNRAIFLEPKVIFISSLLIQGVLLALTIELSLYTDIMVLVDIGTFIIQ